MPLVHILINPCPSKPFEKCSLCEASFFSPPVARSCHNRMPPPTYYVTVVHPENQKRFKNQATSKKNICESRGATQTRACSKCFEADEKDPGLKPGICGQVCIETFCFTYGPVIPSVNGCGTALGRFVFNRSGCIV